MSKSIKGLAKVDIKEEVGSVVEGLRSKVQSQVEVSAAHLKTGLAEVVGCHLLPFVGTLGGELVMCCKKMNVPEVWEAAGALALAVGASCAKSLCEPLLEHMTSMVLTSEALQAARTFIAVCGRHISSPVRSAVEYAALHELYNAVVYGTTDGSVAEDAIDLLATSLTAPYLFNGNPIVPHAIYALRAASASNKFTSYTRTTALSTLRCFDGQTHTQAAPLVVPKLEEIEAQLKKLQGLDADAELAFFNAAPVPLYMQQEQASQAQASLASLAPTSEAARSEPATEEKAAFQKPAALQPVVAIESAKLPSEGSTGQFFTPIDSPVEGFSRKRSASPPADEPVAKKVETFVPISLPLFGSTTTSLLQPTPMAPLAPVDSQATVVSDIDLLGVSGQSEEPEKEDKENGDNEEKDEDSMSSISASLEVPDVEL